MPHPRQPGHLLPCRPAYRDASRRIASGRWDPAGRPCGRVRRRPPPTLGGYPAQPLREALGVRVEEYRPLRRSERIVLSDGTHSTTWSESLRSEGTETLATYTHGMLAGSPPSPALLRHRIGLLPLHPLDDTDCRALVGRLRKEAGVQPDVPDLPTGVEAVTRRAPDDRHRHVLINHRADAVPLPDPAHDLLTATTAHELPPGGCAVLRTR
ncbi:beta-galactosidase trimerization domain-containing protein [Streptomyces sp. NPDC002133]|uniref:beta-galactosidase trimerization domain-containing protein n=1 Tax=Streptomyces sp. NPDC002133 TaxID=3154409 RepID=UPI00332745F6